MNFKKYINDVVIPDDFKPSNISKKIYLDIAEIAYNAYTKDELEKVFHCKNTKDIDIHAYSRIAMVLSFLISNDRKTDQISYMCSLMDLLCKTLKDTKDSASADFTIKEIMLAYKCIKPYVDEDKKAKWLNDLKHIDPYECYHYTLGKVDEEEMHNINIYNIAGEFLRESEGLTDTTEYFKKHWPVQLKKFDDNGMYMDPKCPILYDITTRCQMQLILGHGYDGEFANRFNSVLEEGGYCTLFMQSSAFEMPYGGRSNQYLFNEALIAANCEYEAKRHKQKGNIKLAGMYKRAAHLSIKSICRWLEEGDGIQHIKNFFPVESKYGTEEYGYYNKYMITLGSFIYMAFLFADDTIEEVPCPAEIGGYVFETSPGFHKIFANFNSNSIEIDTNADFHYEATGLGRYHKQGVPTELCLSIPLVKNPNFKLSEDVISKNISICAGYKDNSGKVIYLSQLNEGLEHEVKNIYCSKDILSFDIIYYGSCFSGIDGITESYKIHDNKVVINYQLNNAKDNSVYVQIPVFHFNGKDTSEINVNETSIDVALCDSKYKIETENNISIGDKLYGNRNAKYYLAELKSNSHRCVLELKLSNKANI